MQTLYLLAVGFCIGYFIARIVVRVKGKRNGRDVPS